MNKDIFNLLDSSSLVRLNARSGGPVSLEDFVDVPVFDLSSDYISRTYSFPATDYAPKIRDAVGKIAKLAEKKGCNSNLFTALYEAVLNAHQHGNKLDPNKNVTLAYELKSNKIRAAIIDEGGIFEPDFIPFILSIRAQGEFKTRFHNYYSFSELEKPETNNGTGTSFMHAYVDDVAYLKSSKGGLVVHLVKTF